MIERIPADEATEIYAAVDETNRAQEALQAAERAVLMAQGAVDFLSRRTFDRHKLPEGARIQRDGTVTMPSDGK